jgi:hypothetical protein
MDRIHIYRWGNLLRKKINWAGFQKQNIFWGGNKVADASQRGTGDAILFFRQKIKNNNFDCPINTDARVCVVYVLLS